MIQPGIGLLTSFLVPAARDQGRRVQHNDVEFFLFVRQGFQGIKGIAFNGIHVFQPIQFGVVVYRIYSG